MKWFDSFKYKPNFGTQIFIWDRQENKQIHLNVYWNEWVPNHSFPCWSYIYENQEPILIQPKLSKREACDKCIKLKEPLSSCCYIEISEMQCSENCKR